MNNDLKYSLNTLNLDYFKIYLEKSGWSITKGRYESLQIFSKNLYNQNFKLILPTDKKLKGNLNYIYDAIKILSDLEDESFEKTLLSLKYLDSDLQNFRFIKGNESIPLSLAQTTLESTRSAIHDSIKYEQKSIYYSLSQSKRKGIESPTERARNFLDKCNFPHTWKGSFGLSIQVPLELETLGLLNEGILPETLGRKTSYNLLSGFKLFNIASEKKSKDYVLDQINSEDHAFIFKNFLSLGETIENHEIQFTVKPSPTIKNSRYEELKSSFPIINRNTINYIYYTVEQIEDPDDEKDIEFIGFPKTLDSDRDSLLSELSDLERIVTVKGQSPSISSTTLKLKLSLADYKKALDAQDNVKFVYVKCKVSKAKRGWEVIKLYKFDILNESN